MADDFGKILSDAARDHQYVVLGDSFHADGNLLRFAAKPEHMRALAAQGVKHFFLEQEELANPAFQLYQDGHLSRPDMLKRLDLYAPHIVGGGAALTLTAEQRNSRIQGMIELLDNAKANGIRVHCIYDNAGTSEMINLMGASTAFGNRLSEEMQRTIKDPAELRKLDAITTDLGHGKNLMQDMERFMEIAERWLEQQTPEYRQKLAKEYQDDVEGKKLALGKARIDADINIAQRMKDIAGESKAAIFYGTGHGMHANDLDDHLPSATRILIAPDAGFSSLLRPLQAVLMDPARGADPRPALGMYALKEQKFISGTQQGIDAFCTSGLVDVSKLSLCEAPLEAQPLAAQPAAAAPARKPGEGGPSGP